MSVLFFVPARGGSQSIYKKNILPIGGKPLILYSLETVCKYIESMREESGWQVVVSTDSADIANVAAIDGVKIDLRPSRLCSDDSPVVDSVIDFVERHKEFEIVVLVQPTSPLIRRIDLHVVVSLIRAGAASAQTIVEVPHNFHYYNQRVLTSDGHTRFLFDRERSLAYNKQLKPPMYAFGNVVATSTHALLQQGTLFASPSRAQRINWPYSLDIDSIRDVEIMEALIKAERI